MRPRDGAARPRSVSGPRGGRRDLCGGRRRGTARTADAEKSTGSHRRRGRRRGDRKDPYASAERPSSCTASSKRLSSPTARSGKGNYRHEYDFLAGSSQSASSCCPTFSPVEALDRDEALLNTWTITGRFNRRRSRTESSSTGLYNRPRPLGPRPIQRWSNTYAAGRTGQPQDVG